MQFAIAPLPSELVYTLSTQASTTHYYYSAWRGHSGWWYAEMYVPRSARHSQRFREHPGFIKPHCGDGVSLRFLIRHLDRCQHSRDACRRRHRLL
ncbi:hypothetical protein [Nostoc sp. CALU 546]|uniref:hypothetical protein n=1 Tax=Nostoc sp. CALU 546 TaxID=1867241 RepID=UPI003B67DB85